MIISLLLISGPALALQEAPCTFKIEPQLASDFGEASLPIDGAIPVLLTSYCGGVGETEIALHRVVDEQVAEATVITNTYLDSGEWQIVTLESDVQLLEDTDYAIVANGELMQDEMIYHFTTGSEMAQGMGSEAPSLELSNMQAYDQGPDTYEVRITFSIIPSEDLDGLSYIEIFNSDAPDTALKAFLPGNASEIGSGVGKTANYHTDNADEACFFVVQTDGLGNVSSPSMETCMTPQLDSDDGGWWCSSSGSLPTLWTSLLALGAAMFRRQRRGSNNDN